MKILNRLSESMSNFDASLNKMQLAVSVSTALSLPQPFIPKYCDRYKNIMVNIPSGGGKTRIGLAIMVCLA